MNEFFMIGIYITNVQNFLHNTHISVPSLPNGRCENHSVPFG